jgi:hypothetical protein
LFWPIMLIGAGVMWLLFNAGVLTAAHLSVLGAIWPVILILIGLDLLFGRSSALLSAFIGFGSLALIALLMLIGPSLGWASSGFFNINNSSSNQQIDASGVQTDSFSVPATGVEAAQVTITMPFETATIHPLAAGADAVFEADVEYIDALTFEPGSGNQPDIRLQENVLNKQYTGGEPLTWDVRLSQDVPLDLRLDISSGSVEADLAALTLNALDLDLSSGHMAVSAPESDAAFDTIIDVSSGSLEVTVPDGSGLNLTDVEVSSGSATISVGEGVFFSPTVDVSSGSVAIDLPDDAPVQVNVNHVSSGAVSVPNSYTRTAGDPDEPEGTWESASFSGAEAAIVITIEVSSGSVVVN